MKRYLPMSIQPDQPDHQALEKGLEILAELDRRDLREEAKAPNLLLSMTPFWAIVLGWVFMPENTVAFVKVAFYGVCISFLIYFIVQHIRCYRSNLLLAASRTTLRGGLDEGSSMNRGKDGSPVEDRRVASKNSPKDLSRIKMPKDFKAPK